MSDLDYYSLLEVDKKSDAETIKKSYRRLALKWHPDKNPNSKEEAERRFKLLSEAYEILSDPKKRQIYDIYGKEGIVNGGPSAQDNQFFASSSDQFFGFNPFEFHFSDPMDIFRQVFAGSGFDQLFNSFEPPSRLRRSATSQHNARHHSNPYSQQSRRASGNLGTSMQPYGASPIDGMFGGMLGSFFGGQPGFGMDLFGGQMGGGFSSMTSSFGGGMGGSMRSVSSTSHMINGKTVRVTTVRENDTETVTEEVDGRVVNRTKRNINTGAITSL